MQTKLKKWGNSQGVIIPIEAIRDAGLKLNDMLELKTLKGSITLSLPFRHKTLEERIAEHGGEFLTDDIDLGEPEGRELI